MSGIYSALRQAMADMDNPTRTATASIQTKGGSYSYDYSTLADVLAIVKPALFNNGLTLIQSVRETEAGPRLITAVATDEAGELVLDSQYFTPSEDPKANGSAVTYARRYGLMTAFGLASVDDDGTAASEKVKQKPKEMDPRAAHELKTALERRMIELLREAKVAGFDTAAIGNDITAATGKKSDKFNADDYRAAIRILEERLGVNRGN